MIKNKFRKNKISRQNKLFDTFKKNDHDNDSDSDTLIKSQRVSHHTSGITSMIKSQDQNNQIANDSESSFLEVDQWCSLSYREYPAQEPIKGYILSTHSYGNRDMLHNVNT